MNNNRQISEIRTTMLSEIKLKTGGVMNSLSLAATIAKHIQTRTRDPSSMVNSKMNMNRKRTFCVF